MPIGCLKEVSCLWYIFELVESVRFEEVVVLGDFKNQKWDFEFQCL